MKVLRGRDPTRARNCCKPASCEPGPAYSDPAMCDSANKTCEPTSRISGRSTPRECSSRLSSSGWMSCDCGTEEVLAGDGGAHWLTAHPCKQHNTPRAATVTAGLPRLNR